MLTHKAPGGTVFFFHRDPKGRMSDKVHVLRKGKEVATSRENLEAGYRMHAAVQVAAKAFPDTVWAKPDPQYIHQMAKVESNGKRIEVPLKDIVDFIERTGGLLTNNALV